MYKYILICIGVAMSCPFTVGSQTTGGSRAKLGQQGMKYIHIVLYMYILLYIHRICYL
jgi:hypothetical protein